MEDMIVYLAVKGLVEGGKAAYGQADKRVQQYADERGISKREAWAEIRTEARRRGDRSVEAASDWMEKHPVLASTTLSMVPVVGLPLVTVLRARRWRRERNGQS